MSQDSGNKTEKPTQKRIDDARKEGQVAKSQDFNGAMVLITASGMMLLMGKYTFTTLFSIMATMFDEMSHYAKAALTVNSVVHIVSSVIQSILWTLMPFLVPVFIVAIFSNLIQIKPLFSPKAIQPKLDKINPINGFKRVWSMRSIVEVLKAFVKMGIIGGCSYLIIQGHLDQIMGLTAVDIQTGWGTILKVAALIALWSSVLFFILGVIDWRYQAYELEKQLRMSKQDIKDERKNQEGDPQMKGRIRQMGIKIAQNKQLAEVPTADVIITNPTHYSIAIKYDPDIAPAPRVVAKGVDHFAMKIREVAKEHHVPMIENRPVAQTLYKITEPGHMIPPDLFVAVAEILAIVFSKQKGRRIKNRKNNT